MRITDEFKVFYDELLIGFYYVFSNKSVSFTSGAYNDRQVDSVLKKLKLEKDYEQKEPIKLFSDIMKDENRVEGRKRIIYTDGKITMERLPQETGDIFWVYRQSAEKGEKGYSKKRYVARHYEGPDTPEDMNEWAQHYCFEKMDDGTFVSELDEAWWWGGGHNDGGTIHTEIPEEWFSLPYDKFLENVVTLSRVSHYGFTAEELKKKTGLKKFFGF